MTKIIVKTKNSWIIAIEAISVGLVAALISNFTWVDNTTELVLAGAGTAIGFLLLRIFQKKRAEK